jgi:ComF family protein
VWSLVEYDQEVAIWIRGLKYSGHRELAKPLGDALARQLGPVLHTWRVEALIPVPLHAKRARSRGYNQASLLAQSVSKRLEILLDTKLLERTEWRDTQAHQGKSGRKNVNTMFRCSTRAPYKTICLVDDVCTTGATLSACTRALSQAGVEKVVAITVARA